MPTLAVVEGFAIGGGLAIAACCDLRVATPGSRFGVPIARTLGNCLSVANTARLVAALGASRAKRVLLLAEMITAEEALGGGFLTEIIAPDDLDRRVGELCDRLAHHAPVTMRVTKEAIRRLLQAGLPGDHDLVRETYGSEDFRRGVRAFVDKKEAEWSGAVMSARKAGRSSNRISAGGHMSVIDSHHHFWWREKHTYTWPPTAKGQLDRNFTPDDLAPELKACGIDGTVLIQVQHNTTETAEYLDVARTSGFVRGVVGWVPLADPPAAARALEGLAPRGKLVGIRHLISNESDPDWLLQAPVQESLQRLAAQNLAFDAIPINERQLEAVIATARRHAGSQNRRQSSRPPASARPGLGAVGCADQARRRMPERHHEAVGRARHRVALALVQRRHPALCRPCPRMLRSRPRHGGEQLAGDPAGRQLSGGVARDRGAGIGAQRRRARRQSSAARRSGCTDCNSLRDLVRAAAAPPARASRSGSAPSRS